MRERFWELPLTELDPQEWEALCDGCGKCCLNKIEYEDDGSVDFTRVACRLLDGDSCRCSSYANRHDFVPECVVLTPSMLEQISWWLPATCAYRLRAEGKPLYDWHPLVSGDPESVHRAGASVRGWTVSEAEVPEDDWDDYIIEDLS
ncbi:MAG TPA: YcgN family cysteine cluster protein [Paracoccus sp. (in: a-proteobacteria)]|nr:YcgN family cysteine cluster protein [Paracoccus sp. (in: a-proteobacteria)]